MHLSPGREVVTVTAGPVSRCGSAAFAAQHCPLASGAETAPLGGGGSPSRDAGATLLSLLGHKPCLSCPGASSKPSSQA